MANLVSPGTSVSVINESFYTSAGPGTVPLVIIATDDNKLDASGTQIAEGTKPENAGKVYTITSQRELLQTFGVPHFHSFPGHPTSEYGLLAAHSYLGVSNKINLLRADINLGDLDPTTEPPARDPDVGTYWLKGEEIDAAVYEWDGAKWVKQSVLPIQGSQVIEIDNGVDPVYLSLVDVPSSYKYAVSCSNTEIDGSITNLFTNMIWVRQSGKWVWLFDNTIPNQSLYFLKDFQYSKVYPTKRNDGIAALQSGDIWISIDEQKYPVYYFQDSVTRFVKCDMYYNMTQNEMVETQGYSTLSHTDIFVENGDLFAYATGPKGAAVNIMRTWVAGNVVPEELSFVPFVPGAVIPSIALRAYRVVAGGTGTADIINLTFTNKTIEEIIVTVNSNANAINFGISLSLDLNGYVVARSLLRKTFVLDGLEFYNASVGGFSKSGISIVCSSTKPTGSIQDGSVWYNDDIVVDVLQNSGTNWDNFGFVIYAQYSKPTGVSLNAGDLWLDTSDLVNYPLFKRWSGSAWVTIDNSDSRTPNGIIFADARPSATYGSSLGVNNGGGSGDPDLDIDAPNPLFYPAGLLLFNARASSRCVKTFVEPYVFEGDTAASYNGSTGRWVSQNLLKEDGSPYMGEESVRRKISLSMQAAIQSNEYLRSEDLYFNLIAAPGCIELIDEMVALNIDRKETAVVIGDTPFTLKPDATSLQSWLTNESNQTTNNKYGLVTASDNLALYYPSCGLTTNVDGSDVIVPSSHALLRTYALNDQMAYPWFAPAGLQRGVVSNLSSVGYVDDNTGEYKSVSLNEGQRDVLYLNNVNPVRSIPNKGIIVWGQKTRAPSESALDRVNVARLVNYIRYQAEKISQPFLFEPNDDTTRLFVTKAYETFLSELVLLRGLTDYAVQCNKSNNTELRIDRNELWVDLYILPEKAIEFIYIPIRVRGNVQGV